MSIDWDQVEKNQRSKRHRVYASRQCPYRDKVISESAYSGADGNWRKHARACERKWNQKGEQGEQS